MVRPGFTLVEVITSLALLATGALGLAAGAVVAQRALGAAELEEQVVRHAAALLDSLSFASAVGSDSVRIGGIEFWWDAPSGEAAPLQLTATWSARGGTVTARFGTHRVPVPPVRRP